MSQSFDARSATHTYLIWCYASPKGWDVTLSDISEELDMSIPRVRALCQHKGWLGRLRQTSKYIHKANMRSVNESIVEDSFVIQDILEGRINLE